MKDSAMVPGPALVMIMSAAAIQSSMSFTKPLTTTRIPSGHCLHRRHDTLPRQKLKH